MNRLQIYINIFNGQVFAEINTNISEANCFYAKKYNMFQIFMFFLTILYNIVNKSLRKNQTGLLNCENYLFL